LSYGTTLTKSRESYTKAIDRKIWDTESCSEWLTSNHTLDKSAGGTVSGGDASWKALSEEVYGPFSEYLHDPHLLIVWETTSGWEMIGVATLYWNLKAPGDCTKTKDSTSKEWDGSSPAAFNFGFEKQSDGGIRIAKTASFANSTKAIGEMLKRGMLKPEDLTK